LKTPFIALLFIVFTASLIYAGFHFGIIDSIDEKVKDLDNKVEETCHKSEDGREPTPTPTNTYEPTPTPTPVATSFPTPVPT